MDFKTDRKATVCVLLLLLIANSSLAYDPTLSDIVTNLTEIFVKVNLIHHNTTNILTNLINKIKTEILPDLKTAINDDLCFNHTNLYFEHIFKGSAWALKMFDSSAKFPESLMTGLTMQFGNYDECVDEVHVPPEVGHFQGQYCAVGFGLSQSFLSDYVKLLLQKSEHHKIQEMIFKSLDLLKQVNESMAFLCMAYCIPSTCSPKNFEDGLNGFLRSVMPLLPIKAKVFEFACDVKTEIPFKSEDWMALMFFTFIALIIAASTAYDLMAEGNRNELYAAFSLHKNGKRLLSTNSSDDSVECLHGIRFISMVWIVFAHRAAQYGLYPDLMKTKLLEEIKDWRNYYIINPSVNVDTFLFITGFLITRLFLKNMMDKKSGFNIPLYYLLRYLRITPVYAVVILIQATLYRHVMSGPFSKFIGEIIAKDCQEHWTRNMLYVTNYENTTLCVGHGWYNSVDMQLYVLSPLLLLALWKLPKRWNVAILSTLTAAGFIVPFIISYTNELPANILKPGNNTDFWMKLYYPTHARFGPWVIGAAFAYYLSDPLNRRRNLSLLKVSLLWILGLGLMVAAIQFAYPLYQLDANYSNFTNALYNATFRNVWAFGVGLTVMLCELGYGGPVNSFFSWKFFHPLSKLTYCAYLIHMGIQFLDMSSRKNPLYYSKLMGYRALFADIVMTLGLSAVFSLCFESPIISIAHVVTGKGSSTTGRKKPVKGYKQLL